MKTTIFHLKLEQYSGIFENDSFVSWSAMLNFGYFKVDFFVQKRHDSPPISRIDCRFQSSKNRIIEDCYFLSFIVAIAISQFLGPNLPEKMWGPSIHCIYKWLLFVYKKKGILEKDTFWRTANEVSLIKPISNYRVY